MARPAAPKVVDTPKPTATEVAAAAVMEATDDTFPRFAWGSLDVTEGSKLLAHLKAEVREGESIIANRMIDPTSDGKLECYTCHGRMLKFMSCLTMKDPQTDLMYNVYFCSQRCAMENERERRGGNVK